MIGQSLPRRTSKHRQRTLCALLSSIGIVLGAAIWLTTRVLTGSNLTTLHPDLQQSLRSATSPYNVTLVVASQTTDDTTWLENAFPEWSQNIYVTDDQNAALTVPTNRGREGMVYLRHYSFVTRKYHNSYIIDHYDQLPEIVIFQHANQYQWHNDDPLYDGRRMLERLQLPHVLEEGYVNLRCVWTLGCQVEIRPLIEETEMVPTAAPSEQRAGWYYKEAFQFLFPEIPVPSEIGLSCCAQFAVTAAKLRERPKSDYEHYRRWLLETPLADELSGRIMEYSWHIIFGKDAVHCPDAKSCYCSVYGLCELACEDQGVCMSQYTLPKYSTLPHGWPEYGWDGEWRNVSELRYQQAQDFRPMQSHEQ
ncbi:hypothetical protein D0863_10839 [Hortaea werneckii]|uniref:Uncharacterized protein n=1 Tax=Hortaea werneckii TaxID=91943 RepID=A0A3M7DEQ3_HORWE|nr:hypothetical protein D0863_10839 [Hortaea werneckii]